LGLVTLLPEDIEALIAGDIERAGSLKQVAWRIRVIVERSSRT